jgi:hypothetical protein
MQAPETRWKLHGSTGLQRRPRHARPLRLPLRLTAHRRCRRHEEPARRQGRQPGRDVPPGHPRTARLHDQHRGLHRVYPVGSPAGPRRAAGDDRRRGARGRGRHRGRDGQALRQRGRPAAAVGALGRTRLDAGDDGHHPQPGPERRGRRRPGRPQRQRALRLGQLPPLHPDVRRRGDGAQTHLQGRARPLRGGDRCAEDATGRPARHGVERRRPPAAGAALQVADPLAPRARLPHRPLGAALGRGAGGVRELEQRARQGLPRAQRHPGVLGHGGQRAGDGVRQPR